MSSEGAEIESLKISDKEKTLLRVLTSPKNIAEIAVILDTSYIQALTKLMVLEARGYIKKTKKGRISLYFLNQNIVKLEQNNNTIIVSSE